MIGSRNEHRSRLIFPASLGPSLERRRGHKATLFMTHDYVIQMSMGLFLEAISTAYMSEGGPVPGSRVSSPDCSFTYKRLSAIRHAPSSQ
jgi:hypothetical protein